MSQQERATFGAGCFWCVETIFKQVRGVESVVSGYAGGKVENPTYEQVCSGTTGHIEVVQVEFDPSIIAYEQLLDIFWTIHDPTSRDKQGNDVGEQYRSVIFYHSDEQKQKAEESKQKRDQSGEYAQPIVTDILPVPPFYPAEDYHQNYYDANPSQPYCQLIISPKIKKFREKFSELLKQ